MDPSEHIVICGAGIIGAATAYYLSLREDAPRITVIERNDVACSSSGKAGGFLGEGFGDGSVTEQLHRVSYKLHAELAKTLQIESYRTIPTLSCRLGGRPKSLPAPWLAKGVSTNQMDKIETTAQVTPKELTEKLIAAAKSKGVKVLIGSGVDSPIIESKDGKNKITGVKLQNGTTLQCTKLLVTMGAWSVLASDWFNVPVPMEGIKSTSIVFNDIPEIKEKPFALFCEGDDANGCHLEVYPRPNGEVYLCGIGGSDYIKASRLKKNGDSESADLILAPPDRVDAACKSFFELVTTAAPQKPHIAQACLRPCAPDALPIMDSIPGCEGAFICCGHNCWGILWGPASGLSMSELLMKGKSESINLKPYSIQRFMKQQQQRGRKNRDQPVGEQW